MSDRLDDIKARVAAATPGPWKWEGDMECDEWDRRRLDTKDHDSANKALDGPERSVLIPWDYESYSCGAYIREEDAVFIANAPTDIEWLIAEVERLRGIIVAVAEHGLDSPELTAYLEEALA